MSLNVGRNATPGSVPPHGEVEVPKNWLNDTRLEVYRKAEILGCSDDALTRRTIHLVIVFTRPVGTGSTPRTGDIYIGTSKPEVDTQLDNLLRPPKGFAILSVKTQIV